MLTREALLAPVTLPTEVIAVPELAPGGQVILRGMSGAELVDFQRVVDSGRKKGNGEQWAFPAKLVARCIVDESGNRVLHDDDWQVVQGWPSIAYRRLFEAAMRLNGMGEAQVPLGETPTDDFSSD